MRHSTNRRGGIHGGTLLVLLILVAGTAQAHHPIDGETMHLQQPDGSQVEVRAFGDEFYARIESVSGYTLVRDPNSGVICYADLASDGQRLISTGVPVASDPPAWLLQHLQLAPKARQEQARPLRERFAAEEAAMRADKTRDPQPSNRGDVLGLTIIIDFSDQPGTVPASDFDAYLNEEGYAGYGNNGSVRDYFYDVSGGALNYTNWVPSAYVRAPHPKSYYEDPDIDFALRARALVVWSLNHLDDQGHDFSVYDANDDGYIDAINVFYAGSPSGGWSVGLWPHSWVLSFNADGVSAYKYQITNIGSSLRLSTFCHENGHMIMFWPDLYDYGYESSGIGGYGIMCNSGSGTNPVRPCAYLRAEAGWEAPIILEGLQGDLPVSHEDMTIYKVPRPGYSNEFYLVENRQQSGRDASLPDAGLAIWHVDTNGSNDNEQMTYSQHYLVTLVQADGDWDLENGNNGGDSGDLWSAPDDIQFDPTTVPRAEWWDDLDAPIYIDGVSASGPVMTFNYREALGTMGVTVQIEPAGLLAPWTLTGPNDYLLEGEGMRSVLVWDEGDYTLTWGDVPGWSEPDPLNEMFTMVDGGAPAVFVGTYSNPPFATVDVGAAADAGAVRGVTIIDFDADGDQDLHVINDAGADVLLRNDAGFSFASATPAGLADTGAGRASAWADYDDDGDLDVYLVRAGEANLMLEQDGGVFTDVAALSFGFGDAGAGSDAMWTDYDRDGLMDLYLVQDGANVLFRNFGDLGTGHPLMLSAAMSLLQNAGLGATARWVDFDLDGDRDVYLVNDSQENVLASNFNGIGFDNVGQNSVDDNGAGRDVVWADFDNDGDWDLYLVNDTQVDKYYKNVFGSFQRIPDAVVSDDGPGQSAVTADFDNDGNLDLYVARDGVDDLLIFGDGAGGFASTTLGIADTAGSSVVAVCADFDGDGGLDVYVGRDGEANIMLRNTVVDRGHWLDVDLEGSETNLGAIGARVRVVAGDHRQMREVSAGDGRGELARRLHFGLAAATTVDSVIVTWPNGDVTSATDKPADQVIVMQQDDDATPVENGQTPLATSLRAAYPNPFNPTTTIAFDLERSGPVRLDVYSLDGRLVRRLVDESRTVGTHRVLWQGNDDRGRRVASGAYVCRLQAADTIASIRLMLVK